MKKFFLILSILTLVLMACGNNTQSSSTETTPSSTVASTEVSIETESSESNKVSTELVETVDETKELADRYKIEAERDYYAMTKAQEAIPTLTSSEREELLKNTKSLYDGYISSIDAITDSNFNGDKITTLKNTYDFWQESIIGFYNNYADVITEISTGKTATENTDTSSHHTLVYEDEKVKIYYVGIVDVNSLSYEKGIAFLVENLTDIDIKIQANSIALNGKGINEILMSDDVPPKSEIEVYAKCNIPEVGEVTKVSGQLRIVASDRSFKIYDATFSNVEID